MKPSDLPGYLHIKHHFVQAECVTGVYKLDSPETGCPKLIIDIGGPLPVAAQAIVFKDSATLEGAYRNALFQLGEAKKFFDTVGNQA